MRAITIGSVALRRRSWILCAISGALAFLDAVQAGDEPIAFRRGDSNVDARVDISDGLRTIGFLFLGDGALDCEDAADANDSGRVDLSDAIATFSYLFLGGPTPPAPGPDECGVDETAGDGLGCESYAECPPVSSGDPVVDALSALGVDSTPTPRLDPNGMPLPDDFDPFGGRLDINRALELFVAGVRLPAARGGGEASVSRMVTGIIRDASFVWDPNAKAPWALESTRDLVAADVDGDGVEEGIVVYYQGSSILLATISGAVVHGGESGAGVEIGRLAGVRDLSVAAGDFDGDGADEIAIGLSTDASFRLLVADRSAGVWTLDARATRDYEPLSGESLPGSMSLDAGDTDGDPADELVVVVNDVQESFFFFGNVASGAARVYILDDAASEFTELEVEFYASGGDAVRVIAGAAFGDTDGDGLEEIVVGLLTVTYEPQGGGFGGEILMRIAEVSAERIDDANRGFARGGLRTISGSSRECSTECGNVEEARLHRVAVHTLDADGNGRAEALVLDRWLDAADLHERGSLTPTINGLDPWVLLLRSAFTSAVGDLDGNGRDEMLALVDQTLLVFNVPNTQLRELDRERVFNPGVPAIVLGNLDAAVMDFARHEQVFTEPIVNAVLAAPPCGVPGQTAGSCQTAIGISDSSGGSIEDSFTVSTSAHIGLSQEFSVLGFEAASVEVKATVNTALSTFDQSAYVLTRSIEYTSGNREDSVIVTTVPYDRYIYDVTAHTNPALIGSEVVVSLPREAVTVLVERGFYEERIARERGVRIDSSVLSHSVGDPSSYPTRAERDAIFASCDQVERPFCDHLSTALARVGQGGGTTGVALTFDETTTQGYSFSIGAELEVSTSALGVMAGFSIGVERGSTLSYSKGRGTRYSGVVGNIAADQFENAYGFGLFTYVHEDAVTGQQFEVIQYWVE